MSTLPFDIEPRFFARATGQRIQFNPDTVLSVEWELLEAGGTGQVTVKTALPFEACPVQGGDVVEVWALNGETAPRCRAVVSIPDPTLDLKETLTITAYGYMEDMNHVVIDRVDCFPGGQDLSWFASHIADDYAARRPGFDFVTDIQTTDVALETFNCADTTARAAMDQLQKQAGRDAVWGWDIEPQTGKDRFYLRPRVPSVGHQWFVGDRVKVISGATDFSVVTNAIKVQGGDAKYPQLLTNPSFEVPQIPSAATGDRLFNGGFEDTPSGGSTDAGGNTDAAGWHFEDGASRNTFDPDSNHNSSAHTGRWYVILDNVGEEAWQDVAVTAGTQYTLSLYAALESGASASQGELIVEGRDASGTLVATLPALTIAPPSTTWTGGQGTTIDSGDAISMPVRFDDATITTARVRLRATANVSGKHGLLIDDVVLTSPGEVGQLGWSTHLQHPGSALNQFVNLDWANKGAAWEGLYGVRAQVVADTNDRPAMAPFPGDDSGAQGYHFKPSAQQSLRGGVRVRMTPGGINASAGLCRIEYREWAGDGHETQHVFGPDTTIPNDGGWVWIAEDITTHGDVGSATFQLVFAANGTYDVDGFTARDVAAGEGAVSGTDPKLANYLRSATFERYVTAEEVCDPGSDSAGSAAKYGRREAIVGNKDIVDWNADAIAWAKAYFDRNAVPVNRSQVELIHEPAQVASPGEGTQVQVSGLNGPDLVEWPSRIQYSWAKSALAVSMELSNERPTLAKLLKQIDNSSTGGGSSSAVAAIAGGSGTISTPAAPAEATTTSEGVIQLAGDLAGVATLPVVAGLQGSPVSAAAPAAGQAPVWNGSEYAPATVAAFSDQSANTFLAGPASGSPAASSFRAITPADLPVFGASGTTHAPGAVPDPGATAGTTRFLREDGTWNEPAGSGGRGGIEQIDILPTAMSSNYGNLYLKHISGVKDTLWISMQDATGNYHMAQITLGAYALNFDPLLDVSGCQLWIAADKLTDYTDGDLVTTVPDYSMNGLSFTDGASLGGVTYIANAYNGLPCLRNSGGTQVLYDLSVPSGITATSNTTIFIVYKHGGLSGEYYIPICIGCNGYLGANNGLIPGYLHYPDVNNAHSGVGTATWYGEAPAASNIAQVTILDTFGGLSDLRINGIDKGGISPSPNSSVAPPTNITSIFGTTPTSPNAEIDLCEIIIYNGVLSSTDYAKVENYLQAKWGLV